MAAWCLQPRGAVEHLLLILALHAGGHHTAVDKDDGAPDATGPRFEVEAGVQPSRWFSASLTAAYWSYEDAGLYDGVTHSSYDLTSSHRAAGVRLLVHPHSRIFLGGTLWFDTETETTSSGQPILAGSHDHSERYLEVIAGGTVAKVGTYELQAMVAFAAYGRYDDLEHVEMGSFMLGVRRAFSAAR